MNETLNELYVTAHDANSDGNQAEPSRFLVSRDQGASFQEESIPASFTQYTMLKAHAAGVLFTSYDFETKTLSIHTYTSATKTWTLATAQDNRLGSLSGDKWLHRWPKHRWKYLGLRRTKSSRHRRAQYLQRLAGWLRRRNLGRYRGPCAARGWFPDAAPYVGEWGTLPECLNTLATQRPLTLQIYPALLAGENTMTILRTFIFWRSARL